MRYYFLNVYLGRIVLAAIADVAAFLVAGVIAWHTLSPPFEPEVYASAIGLAALCTFVLLYYTDAYGLQVLGSGRRTFSNVMAAMGVGLAVVLVIHLTLGLPPWTLETGAHVAGLYVPLLMGERLAFRFISSHWTQRVVVVGVSALALAIARAVRDRRNLGIEIAGFLSDDPGDQGAWLEGYPVVGRIHEIEKVLLADRIGRIVVASKRRDEHFPAEELLSAKLAGVRVESGVSFYERVTGRIYLRELHESYLIFGDGFRVRGAQLAAKRALDMAAAAVGLLLLSPVLAVAALAVRLDTPGPAVFMQERVGRAGRIFRVRKLRSMRHDAEKDTGAVFCGHGDDRVTRVGSVLRKTRLDELPQLWNVLVGDMSLVGPRPERPEFVHELCERYPYFRYRAALRPGITGWAQIRHGYVNDVSGFEEKLALDLYYMKYRSFMMDLLILWKTLKTVFLLRGV